MPEYTWKDHVKVIGQPDLSYPELVPMEIDEAWLSSANKADAAFFVKINDAEFVEADGLTQYAPEAEGDGGNGKPYPQSRKHQHSFPHQHLRQLRHELHEDGKSGRHGITHPI